MKRIELLGLWLLLSVTTAQAVEPKVDPSKLSPNMVTEAKPKTANINMKALHRLDFMVKGKSCAVCLLKIQKRLNETPGVVEVAVMLKKPYGGVCIYDSSKLTKDKLLRIAKGDELTVTFEEVTDEAIEKLPIILVPHHATETEK